MNLQFKIVKNYEVLFIKNHECQKINLRFIFTQKILSLIVRNDPDKNKDYLQNHC